MPQIDPKTFDPHAPEFVEPERPHGPVNVYGEWEWEFMDTNRALPLVYAVLWRDPYSVYATNNRGDIEVQTTLTTPCPFCRARHEHGLGDGHRQPHCAQKRAKDRVVLSDGVVVFHKDGYIIRTRRIARDPKPRR